MTLPDWAKRAEDGAIAIDSDAAYRLYLGKLRLSPGALALEIARRCIQADLIDWCVVHGEDYGHQRFQRAGESLFRLASHPWDDAKAGPLERAAGARWREHYANLPPVVGWPTIVDAYKQRYLTTGEATAPKHPLARGAFEAWLRLERAVDAANAAS